MKKRGQLWYADFIIGLVIITLICVLFFMFIKEISINQRNMDEMINVGVEVSNYFMSEGSSKENWLDVPPSGKLGLVTEQKVDSEKMARFRDFFETNPDMGYKWTKYLLGIEMEYALYFEYLDPYDKNLEREYYGKPNVDPMQIEYPNMRVTRYVFLPREIYDEGYTGDTKGQIVRMVVVVWKE